LLVATTPVISNAEDKELHPILDLSPDLLALLRAEMAELSGGTQAISLAIVAADWDTIELTSKKMHASYIMKQSLTTSQAEELAQKLPQSFKHLDAAFHARAKLLASAARSRDSELVAFHYYRLVETCSNCHEAYAKHRFPGFAHIGQEKHEH